MPYQRSLDVLAAAPPSELILEEMAKRVQARLLVLDLKLVLLV
jgi:hypothetical protein